MSLDSPVTDLVGERANFNVDQDFDDLSGEDLVGEEDDHSLENLLGNNSGNEGMNSIEEEELLHTDEDDFFDEHFDKQEDLPNLSPNMDTSNLEKEDLQRLVNVFQKQITYMRDRLWTLNQELAKRESIIQNLTWRFDHGELQSNANQEMFDTKDPETLRVMMAKNEIIARKTMLENFDLKEQNEELKETVGELNLQLQAQRSQQPIILDDGTAKVPHRRKRSMSVGAIAWLDDDDLGSNDDSLDVKEKKNERKTQTERPKFRSGR